MAHGRIWTWLILACGVVGCSQYWLSDAHPPVGTYVAILGAVAAVMALREKPGKWEKASWLFIMFSFAVLEIFNLYRDRAEHDKQQAETRNEELKSFKKIAEGVDSAIKESQRQFAITTSGISSALREEQKTLWNTIPRASLVFSSLVPSSLPLSPSEMGRVSAVNVAFTNSGNDSALAGC